MENDYKNSVIYRIYCKDENIKDCYIGSTIDLYNRFKAHKASVNNRNLNNYNLKIYQFIRENGGWDNFDREILEYYSCNNEEELKQKEQEYIDKYNPTLNIHNAFRTEEVRKEQQKTNFKKWKKTEKGRESVLNSCRKRTEKLMNDPEKYQQKLKNKSEWGKKPKFCEVCNRTVTNDGWSHHKKTKLHQNNLLCH